MVGREKIGGVGSQIDRQTDRDTEKGSDRQTDRQTGRGRQAGRQAQAETDRQRKREKSIFIWKRGFRKTSSIKFVSSSWYDRQRYSATCDSD